MSEEIRIFKPDEVVLREGESTQEPLYILSGQVLIYRHVETSLVPIALVGDQELIGIDKLFGRYFNDYMALAVSECAVMALDASEYTKNMSEMPDWLQHFLHHQLMGFRQLERPERVNIATLYSICNMVYAFSSIVNTSEDDTAIRGALYSVIHEVEKSKPVSRTLVEPVLKALNNVGMIDIRHSDPIQPSLVIPDVELYRMFLGYMQKVLGIKEGIYVFDDTMNYMEMDEVSEKILDTLLMNEDITQRCIDPDRSMMHMSLEQITEIIADASPELTGTAIKTGLYEMERHGALSSISDNQVVSVFLNLRNLLRLNIHRDLITNFIDIIEYLLFNMHEKRVEMDHRIVSG